MRDTFIKVQKRLFQFSKPHIKSTEKTCENCPTTSTCSPLHCALVIIEKLNPEQYPTSFNEEVSSFIVEVNKTGFAFPTGEMNCELVEDEEKASNLVQKAATLLKKANSVRIETEKTG